MQQAIVRILVSDFLQFQNLEHLFKTVPQQKQGGIAKLPTVVCHGMIAGMMPVMAVLMTPVGDIVLLGIPTRSGRHRSGQITQATHGACISKAGMCAVAASYINSMSVVCIK